MKGVVIPYSDHELAFVESNKRLPIRTQFQLFQLKFGRPDVSCRNFNAMRKRKGFLTGRTGRFEKGNPHNPRSGAKGPNATSFKKGETPPNRNPVGHERVDSKDGYVLVKVKEKDPHTGRPTRYKLKHQVVWEAANGPIPDGYIIIFKDGDKRNFSPENLVAVKRAHSMYLNRHGYSDMPVEVRDSMIAMAKLDVAVRERVK